MKSDELIGSLFKDYVYLQAGEEEKHKLLIRLMEEDKKMTKQVKLKSYLHQITIAVSVILLFIFSSTIIDNIASKDETVSNGHASTPATINELKKIASDYLKLTYTVQQENINEQAYKTALKFGEGNPFEKIITEFAFRDAAFESPLNIVTEAYKGQFNLSVKTLQVSHATSEQKYEFFSFSGKILIENEKTFEEKDINGQIAFKYINDGWKIVLVDTAPLDFNNHYEGELFVDNTNLNKKSINSTFTYNGTDFTGFKDKWGLSSPVKISKGEMQSFSLVIHPSLLSSGTNTIYAEVPIMDLAYMPFAYFSVEKDSGNVGYIELNFENKFPKSGDNFIVLRLNGKVLGIIQYPVN